MLIINEWAERWGVPVRAIEELQEALGTASQPASSLEAMGEAAVQSRVRLSAANKGMMLWRNNVGAYTDENGNFIRYGLANDSSKVNKRIKSSDLIGIKCVTIRPEHVGQIIGQFVAYETKRAGWSYRGTEHEQAQLNFINLVVSMGGFGKFINNAGDL